MKITRQQLIDAVEHGISEARSLTDEESEKLREFARTAATLAFGSFTTPPGCPLVQTGLWSSVADGPLAELTTPELRAIRERNDRVERFAYAFDRYVNAHVWWPQIGADQRWSKTLEVEG